MSKDLIEQKKAKLKKLNKSISHLTKLCNKEKYNENFISNFAQGVEVLSPAFMPAALPAMGAVEILESMELDKVNSKAKKVATVAFHSVAATPLIAASIAIGFAPAIVLLPTVTVVSAVSSVHKATLNKRIKKAPARLKKLTAERDALEMEIKNLEAESEICK